MYREAVVANSQMFANFDKYLSMRDLYFPYVGQYNHLSGNKNHLIVCVNGEISFLDKGWEKSFGYKKDALITDIKAVNYDLRIQLNINDMIHKYMPVYIRKLKVKNLSSHKKDVKIFFYHDFRLNETTVGNTALYHPDLKGVVHYREATYLFISICPEISEYTIKKKEESSILEIENGSLSMNPIARGDIDSAVSYNIELDGNEEKEFYYYIVAGHSFDDIEEKLIKLRADTTEHFVEETEIYWKAWLNERKEIKRSIDDEIKELYDRSLLIIKAHMDKDGSIIASADSSIFQRFNKDHYAYSWPRDNSFIVMALDRAGYGHATKRFFEFCVRTLTKKGYFLQKYLPDGSFGSSWHPWIDEKGNPQLPIQEDETALVIWALFSHYQETKDVEFIDRIYNQLVRPAAYFMMNYRDRETGLPRESYDPWEERRGVGTYTCATVFAGLLSASKLAHLTGNLDEARKFKDVAEEVREGILKYLYDESENRFIRMLYRDSSGKIKKDKTVGASLMAVFFTGLLPPDDYRVINTVNAIREKLWIDEGIKGLARFENDEYHRISEKYPGNPWIVTTMWLADWYIAVEKIDEAVELLRWAVKRKSQAGLLAEQYNPETGDPISVTPLTWSHAAFCYTVQNLNKKLYEMGI